MQGPRGYDRKELTLAVMGRNLVIDLSAIADAPPETELSEPIPGIKVGGQLARINFSVTPRDHNSVGGGLARASAALSRFSTASSRLSDGGESTTTSHGGFGAGLAAAVRGHGINPFSHKEGSVRAGSLSRPSSASVRPTPSVLASPRSPSEAPDARSASPAASLPMPDAASPPISLRSPAAASPPSSFRSPAAASLAGRAAEPTGASRASSIEPPAPARPWPARGALGAASNAGAWRAAAAGGAAGAVGDANAAAALAALDDEDASEEASSTQNSLSSRARKLEAEVAQGAAPAVSAAAAGLALGTEDAPSADGAGLAGARAAIAPTLAPPAADALEGDDNPWGLPAPGRWEQEGPGASTHGSESALARSRDASSWTLHDAAASDAAHAGPKLGGAAGAAFGGAAAGVTAGALAVGAASQDQLAEAAPDPWHRGSGARSEADATPDGRRAEGAVPSPGWSSRGAREDEGTSLANTEPRVQAASKGVVVQDPWETSSQPPAAGRSDDDHSTASGFAVGRAEDNQSPGSALAARSEDGRSSGSPFAARSEDGRSTGSVVAAPTDPWHRDSASQSASTPNGDASSSASRSAFDRSAVVEGSVVASGLQSSAAGGFAAAKVERLGDDDDSEDAVESPFARVSQTRPPSFDGDDASERDSKSSRSGAGSSPRSLGADAGAGTSPRSLGAAADGTPAAPAPVSVGSPGGDEGETRSAADVANDDESPFARASREGGPFDDSDGGSSLARSRASAATSRGDEAAAAVSSGDRSGSSSPYVGTSLRQTGRYAFAERKSPERGSSPASNRGSTWSSPARAAAVGTASLAATAGMGTTSLAGAAAPDAASPAAPAAVAPARTESTGRPSGHVAFAPDVQGGDSPLAPRDGAPSAAATADVGAGAVALAGASLAAATGAFSSSSATPVTASAFGFEKQSPPSAFSGPASPEPAPSAFGPASATGSDGLPAPGAVSSPPPLRWAGSDALSGSSAFAAVRAPSLADGLGGGAEQPLRPPSRTLSSVLRRGQSVGTPSTDTGFNGAAAAASRAVGAQNGAAGDAAAAGAATGAAAGFAGARRYARGGVRRFAWRKSSTEPTRAPSSQGDGADATSPPRAPIDDADAPDEEVDADVAAATAAARKRAERLAGHLSTARIELVRAKRALMLWAVVEACRAAVSATPVDDSARAWHGPARRAARTAVALGPAEGLAALRSTLATWLRDARGAGLGRLARVWSSALQLRWMVWSLAQGSHQDATAALTDPAVAAALARRRAADDLADDLGRLAREIERLCELRGADQLWHGIAVQAAHFAASSAVLHSPRGSPVAGMVGEAVAAGALPVPLRAGALDLSAPQARPRIVAAAWAQGLRAAAAVAGEAARASGGDATNAALNELRCRWIASVLDLLDRELFLELTPAHVGARDHPRAGRDPLPQELLPWTPSPDGALGFEHALDIKEFAISIVDELRKAGEGSSPSALEPLEGGAFGISASATLSASAPSSPHGGASPLARRDRPVSLRHRTKALASLADASSPDALLAALPRLVGAANVLATRRESLLDPSVREAVAPALGAPDVLAVLESCIDDGDVTSESSVPRRLLEDIESEGRRSRRRAAERGPGVPTLAEDDLVRKGFVETLDLDPDDGSDDELTKLQRESTNPTDAMPWNLVRELWGLARKG